MLVDFVSKERLDFILKEIQTCKMIIRKYNSQYSRPGERFFEDSDKIYRRFQYHKDQVSSYSHGNKYEDWFYASSMIDNHRKTITQLMLALIDKPKEWIGEDQEAEWDLEVWQTYMFDAQKNFAGAQDALDYAEHLIEGYLNSPELFNKIEPDTNAITP